MKRTLSRNRRWENGMLFGGTNTSDVVVWLSQERYEMFNKPTKIVVDVIRSTKK